MASAVLVIVYISNLYHCHEEIPGALSFLAGNLRKLGPAINFELRGKQMHLAFFNPIRQLKPATFLNAVFSFSPNHYVPLLL